MEREMRSILERFPAKGTWTEIRPMGRGHINRTFLAETDAGAAYLLQRINDAVFPDVDGLMENILLVTEHLRRKIKAAGGDPERETMRVIPAKDGRPYARTDSGCWRLYPYLSDTVTIQAAQRPEEFYLAARAFGRFQALLEDFPARRLHAVIPEFHNTPKRLRDLWDAAEKDTLGRRREVERELDFLRQREAYAAALEQAGLPVRVTHNDTKLNNLLFDKKTMQPVCVVDLDTIMPGTSLYDFGDAIRYGVNTAAEDETDLDKVTCDLALYEAFCRGWLGSCGEKMTAGEKDLLADSARIITLECGARFLEDYLRGDGYFATSRPGQNLDRARNQLRLAAELERRDGEIRRMIGRFL